MYALFRTRFLAARWVDPALGFAVRFRFLFLGNQFNLFHCRLVGYVTRNFCYCNGFDILDLLTA